MKSLSVTIQMKATEPFFKAILKVVVKRFHSGMLIV